MSYILDYFIYKYRIFLVFSRMVKINQVRQ